MTLKISNPFPLFLNARGDLLDGGSVYIGTSGADPETSPLDVFWDAALTDPADQPLRTKGGVIVNDSAPASVFIDEDDYSIRTRDSDGSQVSYAASAVSVASSFQPLDSDLTAIAALTTTTFGRALLALADAAALRTAAGLVPYLPLSGGTVTGNIIRSSAGGHIYHGDAGLASGKISIIALAASLPSGNDGDLVFRLKV
ncbi:MAG: hypothetical protein V4696_07450 [Pseudomonadota bacterium]